MTKVIALDIGGTKIEGALVSTTGKTSNFKKIYHLSNETKKSFFKNIFYIIEFLKYSTKDNISGIGISISGIINDNGKILSSGNNLSFLNGLNLKKIIQNKFKIKTIVENDANCFALAENIYGKFKKEKCLVGVIWGTGIGSGIVVNKEILKGKEGGAGEIGRIKIPLYFSKYKKQMMELDKICGGKAIKNYFPKKSHELPSKILLEKSSKELKQRIISSLSWGLSVIVNTLNPDVIVMGGGISNVPKSIYFEIKKEMKKYCDYNLFKKLKLEKFSLSDDAGILGAGYLAFKQK